jgi:hypothetical protein
MSKNQPPFDFEKTWQAKISTGLDQILDPEERDRILAGAEDLEQSSSTLDKATWTCEMFTRLEEVTDEKTRQEILTGCACHYPKAELDDARGIFLETGDVDQVIDLLQAKFEDFLLEDLELDEELVGELVTRGWGLAGVREGRQIIATKIPKSAYLEEYFETEDPQEKRKLYCHCPRVRDNVGEDPHLPETYCFCGAGFYQGIWETVLREPVRVEVLESVMTGGDVCKIAIHLPESITLNNNE